MPSGVHPIEGQKKKNIQGNISGKGIWSREDNKFSKGNRDILRNMNMMAADKISMTLTVYK